MKFEIIPINPITVKDKFEPPKPQSEKLSEKVCAEIVNAWNDHTIFDNLGRPWVERSALNRILRTSRENANYRVAKLFAIYKANANGKSYVKGEAVLFLLSESVLNARSLLREIALQYSQQLYIAIQDCDKARLMRAEHYEFVKKIVKNLKMNRMRCFNIESDELTNIELHKVSAEFSHIRSASLYPHLATFQENGLIVNKDTHALITRFNINDEDELLALCKQKKWNILWYEKYLEFIKKVSL
ncbi:TPA: hypothetical protein ACSP3X_000352 [Aeromonas hydrophila]